MTAKLKVNCGWFKLMVPMDKVRELGHYRAIESELKLLQADWSSAMDELMMQRLKQNAQSNT